MLEVRKLVFVVAFGENDWNVTLIDQAKNLEEVRRKESFWQYELNTFEPHGLNEREVTLEYTS